MEEEKNKIQISIYRVDKTLFEGVDEGEIAQEIVSRYNRKAGEQERFAEQPLSDIDLDGFDVKIFYATKVRTPKWNPFLKDILADNAPLIDGRNRDVSYIAFFKDSENLFAISGGQGNFIVQDYVDQNFGIDIITRLITKENKVIKSLQDRGVTGSVMGSTKFFRGNYKLSDEDQFGKIYKQIKAGLNKEILLNEFGFSEDDVKKSAGCLAKASFQINKSIDFDSLLRILGKLTNILSREKQFSLNKVTLLQNKGAKNKALISRLEGKLLEMLFAHCSKGEILDLDFAHQDFERYFVAKRYSIEKGSKVEIAFFDELDNIVDFLADPRIRSALDITDIKAFTTSFYGLRVKALDESDNVLTQGGTRSHIHGEIALDSRTYFLIDNNWYEIQPDFVDDLNKDMGNLILQNQDDTLLNQTYTNGEIENVYNQKFIGQDGVLVLDKVLHENIEICDILKVTENAVYLIHVKKGFDNSIRDLASQVSIAVRRLQADIKSDYSFIDRLEGTLKRYSTSRDPYLKKASAQLIPGGDTLKKLFQGKKDKEIHFGLAFIDTAATPRSIKNPKDFASNIAKFSLIELEKEVHKAGFGFVVTQIIKE